MYTCKFDKRNESLDKALIFITHWLRIFDDVGANSLNIYDLRSLGQPIQIQLNSLFISWLYEKLPFLFLQNEYNDGHDGIPLRNQSKLRPTVYIWPNWTNILGQHANRCHRIIYHICIWLLLLRLMLILFLDRC